MKYVKTGVLILNKFFTLYNFNIYMMKWMYVVLIW